MNRYTKMQKKAYEKGVYVESLRKTMDGEDPGRGDHFKPLNECEHLHECLFKNIELGGVALDYGCGVGRAIVRYSDLFERIDGVDISDRNIELARKYYSWSNIDNPIPPMLWVNNGVVYDVVFSIQVFPHIAVHEIRYGLLKEIYRILKPGGSISIQMGFGDDTKRKVVQYFDNAWDAEGTNGYLDVTITDPEQPKSDFDKIGFTNFEYDIRDIKWKHAIHNQWIYLRAKKW
jgi:SAM-dependent methyltransferase